jgi:hypothetical protein
MMFGSDSAQQFGLLQTIQKLHSTFPIFSDLQQQTFPDLFWLANRLDAHILKDMERVNTFILSNSQLQREQAL